jgi:hypothetical protein
VFEFGLLLYNDTKLNLFMIDCGLDERHCSPEMVMVLSRLAGASLSSQLDIRIMAPLICLQIIIWIILFIQEGYPSKP